MYKYDLTLKNESEWLSYAKELLANTDKTADELLEKYSHFHLNLTECLLHSNSKRLHLLFEIINKLCCIV